MRLELTGRQVRITPTLRRLVDERLEKLDRLLHDMVVSLQVVLYMEKYRHHVEVTLHARGEHFFHGAGSGRDWETALNLALGKVNQQGRKLKGKWDARKRRTAVPAADGAPVVRTKADAPPPRSEEPEVRIIRARRAALKPMSVDEAALELGDGREAFFVFRNAATDNINVLFRRADGHLGWIDPDA